MSVQISDDSVEVVLLALAEFIETHREAKPYSRESRTVAQASVARKRILRQLEARDQ